MVQGSLANFRLSFHLSPPRINAKNDGRSHDDRQSQNLLSSDKNAALLESAVVNGPLMYGKM